MSRSQVDDLKPFLSVVIVVITLFFVVFLKMEIRRQSYSVLQISLKETALQDKHRGQSLKLARIMRSERIKKYAKVYLALNDAAKGQIIHMTGKRIALKQ